MQAKSNPLLAAKARRVPEVRSGDIVAALRNEIISGRYLPGDRLPTRVELEAKFQSCPATINKAFSELIRRGFVAARRGVGTVVAARPPHLARFALVFPSNPSQPFSHGWSALWSAFRDEASRLEHARDLQIPCFYDINGHADVEQFQELLRDAREHSLAGIICAHPPYWLSGLPLEDRPTVPMVGFMSDMWDAVPAVTTDAMSFVDRAIEHLKLIRHRRAAAITVCPPQFSVEAFHCEIARRGAKHGIDFRPHWMVPAHSATAETARYVTRLLLAAPAKDRPDALLVLDDHLVEQAALGVVDSGIRAPEEICIIAHANFPYVPRSAVPVTRLGFDVSEVLAACLSNLEQQRARQAVPRTTSIPARFESELHTHLSEISGSLHEGMSR